MSTSNPLSHLGVANPVWAAPMAGGPTTPELVMAAGRAGSLGFLAGGYLTAADLASQIAAVRSTGVTFGVNLFAPNPIPVDPQAFRRYAETIRGEADRYGVRLAGDLPIEDDDAWREKVDLLLEDPVPLVSFSFAAPDREIVEALIRAGTIVAQTVTSAEEARHAQDLGVNLLVAQAATAGGHFATFTPEEVVRPLALPDLIDWIGRAVELPVVGAGGLSTPGDVAEALGMGAVGVTVGTALLLADESGTSAVHKGALVTATERGTAGQTVVTHAFTGRPARALRNRFADRYHEHAPSGYPGLVHHLTRPLRQAGVAAGDSEVVNLWAGVGYLQLTGGPAAAILDRLATLA